MAAMCNEMGCFWSCRARLVCGGVPCRRCWWAWGVAEDVGLLPGRVPGNPGRRSLRLACPGLNPPPFQGGGGVEVVRSAFGVWALAGNRTRRVRTTPRWVARGMGELAVWRWEKMPGMNGT